MPKVNGRAEVKRYFAQLPKAINGKLLPGAGRAGGRVVADEAKLRAPEVVAKAIVTQVRSREGRIVVTVTVTEPWPRSVGIWAEWGTDPHFIRISDEDRGGLSVRKSNERLKSGSLVINGKFVGGTVFHPGAQAHPFLRPALDVKQTEAMAAAQGYINSRVARMRKAGLLANEDGDE